VFLGEVTGPVIGTSDGEATVLSIEDELKRITVKEEVKK